MGDKAVEAGCRTSVFTEQPSSGRSSSKERTDGPARASFAPPSRSTLRISDGETRAITVDGNNNRNRLGRS